MSFNEKHIQTAKVGFENKCLTVLIEGYRSMKSNGEYLTSWYEEDLSEQLIYYMVKSSYVLKWELDITPEHRLYSDNTAFKNKTAKKSPRIDIRFCGWQSHQKFLYFIESKNLSESDWEKEDGFKVSASYQQKRYVEKGVEYFISGYYPPNGCLCGYVLQGETINIINKINDVLIEKSISKLEITSQINNYNLVYIIKNKPIIRNIFLEFN